jgi:hypothetical protein
MWYASASAHWAILALVRWTIFPLYHSRYHVLEQLGFVGNMPGAGVDDHSHSAALPLERITHGNAHGPQQQNRGRHGDEPQPPIQAEHRQAHQQDRAEEKQQVGHENAVL